MKDYSISTAEKDDWEIAATLDVACFPDPWARVSWESEKGNPLVKILYKDGQPLGFAVGHATYEDYELLKIGVLPEWRGLGYGAALLQDQLKHAASLGAEQGGLEVRASNRHAISLYLQAGFKRQGLRKNYHRDGEDAVWMDIQL